jgi:ATP-binding cassette subfamily F protein uup
MLEDLLAAYQGTLLLVSHDRDFIDRLASSTIGLNGRGEVVETPGGWGDFIGQNPGFFEAAVRAAAVSTSAPSRASAPAPPKKLAKLTYKDQRRLEELEKMIAESPAEIARLEAVLADPGLYARDPKRFDQTMKTLDGVRTRLTEGEEEWLALEEKRESLTAG